jgi:hypothetical protein
MHTLLVSRRFHVDAFAGRDTDPPEADQSESGEHD